MPGSEKEKGRRGERATGIFADPDATGSALAPPWRLTGKAVPEKDDRSFMKGKIKWTGFMKR